MLIGTQRVGGAGDEFSREHTPGIHVRHKLSHIIVCGFCDDLLRAADLYDLALIHHGHAVADAQRFTQVMRDKQNGLLQLFLQVQQFVLHFAADERVERAECLVHQQDVGIGCQRTRQPDALLHTTTEVVGHVIGPGFQPDHIKRFHRALTDFFLVFPAHGQAVADVINHRPVWEEAEMLEDHRHLIAAHFAQLLFVQFSDVLFAHENFAVCRLYQTVYTANQR